MLHISRAVVFQAQVLLHTAIFTLVRVWATCYSQHEAATLLQRRKHIFTIPT